MFKWTWASSLIFLNLYFSTFKKYTVSVRPDTWQVATKYDDNDECPSYINFVNVT